MIRKICAFTATAMPLLAFALTPSAASAQSFTGSFPATVTQSKGANGTYCLTLTDNGSVGFPHSGQASATGANLGNSPLSGTFQVINGLIVVTIESASSGTGQNAGLVFTAHAANGTIGKGVYEVVFDGQELDSGVLVFGVKNGCSN